LKLQTMNLSKPLEVIPPGGCDHPLWPEIERITMDQLYYARLEVEDTPAAGGGSWELFAEDGEMRLYKRELEIDGLVCDPLKAVHPTRGVSGHPCRHPCLAPAGRRGRGSRREPRRLSEGVNPRAPGSHRIRSRGRPGPRSARGFGSPS